MRINQLFKNEIDHGNIMLFWVGKYRRRLKFKKKCKNKIVSFNYSKYITFKDSDKE